MTDLVVGGGAVGTMLAWALAEGGREVAIVRRRHEGPPAPARVAVADVTGVRREATVAAVRVAGELPEAPEVIVFAVKMFDLPEAVDACATWPSAVAVTVANGIGAEAIVIERRGGDVIAGSVTSAVEVLDDGTVARLNRGGVALAPVQGEVAPVVDGLLAALDVAGLRTARFEDAAAMKWSKLVGNLLANATSAILDQSPGEVYADAGAYRLERRMLLEAFAVMRVLGLRPVALPGMDVRWLRLGLRLPHAIGRPVIQRVIAGARGSKDPSLRRHARRGFGPSEVEWLNGAVDREARQLGRTAPVNRAIADLVSEIIADPERQAWFRGRPDRLVAEVERRH